MAVQQLTRDALDEITGDLDPVDRHLLERWVARGDGVAVYENHDLGHPECGHRKFASYGSPAAQFEVDEPPDRLPDMAGVINWRYLLVGTYRATT